MFLSIPSETFRLAVSHARCVVSNTSKLPILTCVRLTVAPATPRVLTVEATDLSIHLTRRFTLPGPAVPGSACILLADLAQVRPDPKTEVILHQRAPWKIQVTASSGRAATVFTFDTLPTAEFPDAPDSTAAPHSSTLLGESALKAVIATLPFHSDDSGRYALNGCLIAPLATVATDGRRLVKYHIRGTPVPIILPTKTARILAALTPSTAIAELPLTDSPDRITLRIGSDTIIHSRLIEGNFPNYQVCQPPACERRVTFADPTTVTKFLRRLKTARNNTVTLTPIPPCQLEITHPAATLVTAAHFTGNPDTAAFNPRFLADCIEAGGATFSQQDALCPAVFLSPTSAALLMPCRVFAPAQAATEEDQAAAEAQAEAAAA